MHGVTLFPLWSDETTSGERRYDTEAGRLDIAEIEGGPSVPHLMATNTGTRAVLVLDGQLFEGGWQHRMATRSWLIAPGARTLVDVACVEQHRWGGERHQVTRGRRAPTSVRHGFDQPGQQHEVWHRVQQHGGGSPTGSLAERLDAPDEVAERLLQTVQPMPGQVGVLIGVGGQPLALEVFDHPRTMEEQFEAVVRAAALDAAGRPPVPTPGRRARRLVERLERLGGASFDAATDAGGLTTLGRSRTERFDVMSLRGMDRCVHLRATHLRHPMLVAA